MAYGPVENNTQGEEGQQNEHETEGGGHVQGGAMQLLGLGKSGIMKEEKPAMANNVVSPGKISCLGHFHERKLQCH